MSSIPPPYPPDTRAKGWRFELDYEQVEQSSTWALAGPEIRPWLLMQWMTAWRQVPCGTLPTDEAVIAALIGMPSKFWSKSRSVMLRGWVAHADGRMYHPTLTSRVIEMMGRRRGEADRKAIARAKTVNVPAMSHGTTTGQPRDSTRNPAPTTDHLQPNTDIDPTQQPTPAGRVCGLIRRIGIQDGNPGHPDLLALIAAGATDEEFSGAALETVQRRKGFAYLIGMLKRQRMAAKDSADQMHRGEMPQVLTPGGAAAAARIAAAVPGLAAKRKPSQEIIDV